MGQISWPPWDGFHAMESLSELPVSLWKTTRERPNAGPPLFLSSLLPCTDKPGDLGAVGNDTHGAALYMPKPLVYRRE